MLGGTCLILGDQVNTEAEVIGFEGDRIFMMPTGPMGELKPGAEVVPIEDKNLESETIILDVLLMVMVWRLMERALLKHLKRFLSTKDLSIRLIDTPFVIF